MESQKPKQKQPTTSKSKKPNPTAKPTSAINPEYFHQVVTKEGKARFVHTYESLQDAFKWVVWIKELIKIDKRIRKLEALHGIKSPEPPNTNYHGPQTDKIHH